MEWFYNWRDQMYLFWYYDYSGDTLLVFIDMIIQIMIDDSSYSCYSVIIYHYCIHYDDLLWWWYYAILHLFILLFICLWSRLLTVSIHIITERKCILYHSLVEGRVYGHSDGIAPIRYTFLWYLYWYHSIYLIIERLRIVFGYAFNYRSCWTVGAVEPVFAV